MHSKVSTRSMQRKGFFFFRFYPLANCNSNFNSIAYESTTDDYDATLIYHVMMTNPRTCCAALKTSLGPSLAAVLIVHFVCVVPRDCLQEFRIERVFSSAVTLLQKAENLYCI